MEKIEFQNNKSPALNNNTLMKMQDNIETHRYIKTLETELTDNSQITLPASYKVRKR